MPDYRFYKLSTKELAVSVLVYAAGAVALMILFYDRWYIAIAAAPGIVPYLKAVRAEKAEKRRRNLTYDFRDALDSLSVSLKAGYSVENAFPAAARDLAAILGRDADITKEMQYISRQSALSIPVENLISDFAYRSGSEDIQNFAAVFTAAKRLGGNMPAIIRSAADSIGGKIDVSREIETTLSAKQMEQKIMMVMPCCIIIYMRLSSPGFLDQMYTTLLGAVVMSACLIGYGAAVYWSSKIVKIEV
ncbi:MAG: type II secretion system F family protein [Lachnospiraceae bacterium]|nr:type II secretion system F family protein [Lachnospiraceae bacterium]